jgi:uncharacterized protein (DUF1330 family)
MAFERWVGLLVHDEEGYRRYREAMTPLLHQAGGRFRYDFRVSQTLICESPDPINRVFLIAFESKAASDAFFADPRYQEIRKEHFASSVSHVSGLATWGD